VIELNHVLASVLALATAGCASPPPDQPARSAAAPGGVRVTADRTSYHAGDPLVLTASNGSADTVAFNPCTRTLEREQSGSWSAVPEPGRMCTMEAWLLAPGEHRDGPTELPADLGAGRYRAVLAFTVESAQPSGARRAARTSPVEVER
jgi:hypothetical protein